MSASRKLTLLVLLSMTAACSTLTTEVRQAEKTDATAVCSVWLAQSYDSTKDTEETVLTIQAANRRREAFCE